MSKFSRPVPAESFLLSEESALAEVMKILDHYDYDIDSVNEKAKDTAEASLQTLVKAFRLGLMELADDGVSITQHLKSSPKVVAGKLTYGEFTGKIKWTMDKIPVEKTYQRIHTLLGAMADVPAETFQSVTPADLAYSEALGFLFITK